SVQRRPHAAALFPYTTLFRSASPQNQSLRTPLSAYGKRVHWLFLRRLSSPVAGRLHRCGNGDSVPAIQSAYRKRHQPLHLSDDHTSRSEEHTSELQSRFDLVCRLLFEKKKKVYILIRL